MINANGTDPSKYSRGIGSILGKVKNSKKDTSSEKEKNLQEYVGYYSQMPWWGETFISTWDGKLVSLGLPSEKPGDSMTFYKHIEGDTFQRIRDNNNLGETLVFERDNNGNIIRYKRHGNYSKKINR